jgi:antitoxin component of RelBE/YafQ-DinJ toxin-antitoxin module
MTKVQLTLTDQEAALLAGYGDQLGYSLTKIAKFFISKATEEILKKGTIPVYEMSSETEARGLAAIEEYKNGKTVLVEDIDDFFKKL